MSGPVKEDAVQPIVNFIASHAWLAAPIMAGVSFAESLAFLSLLVPGWAIMVAGGALAGSGVLDPWPIVLGAIVGAILGDGLSYWIGRKFGPIVPGLWPFRTRRELLRRGYAFFGHWGGISIALGRFFGPVRAIIPLIAGMMSMPPGQFWFWNIASAVVWAPAVVFSGALAALVAETIWSTNAWGFAAGAIGGAVLLALYLWARRRRQRHQRS
jgi:membrane protein DedA with SNARE-associated domain